MLDAEQDNQVRIQETTEELDEAREALAGARESHFEEKAELRRKGLIQLSESQEAMNAAADGTSILEIQLKEKEATHSTALEAAVSERDGVSARMDALLVEARARRLVLSMLLFAGRAKARAFYRWMSVDMIMRQGAADQKLRDELAEKTAELEHARTGSIQLEEDVMEARAKAAEDLDAMRAEMLRVLGESRTEARKERAAVAKKREALEADRLQVERRAEETMDAMRADTEAVLSKSRSVTAKQRQNMEAHAGTTLDSLRANLQQALAENESLQKHAADLMESERRHAVETKKFAEVGAQARIEELEAQLATLSVENKARQVEWEQRSAERTAKSEAEGAAVVLGRQELEQRLSESQSQTTKLRGQVRTTCKGTSVSAYFVICKRSVVPA